MSEFISDNLDQTPVTTLTAATLVGLVEEFAMHGSVEHDDFRPRIFQNETFFDDGRSVYIAKYYTADGDEMPVGEKIGDILIHDSTQKPIEISASERPDVNQIYGFTNYYFVNEGKDESGDQIYRTEKHRIQSSLPDLKMVVDTNGIKGNPEYELESSLGLRTVSEDEAVEIVKLIVEKL